MSIFPIKELGVQGLKEVMEEGPKPPRGSATDGDPWQSDLSSVCLSVLISKHG